MYNTNVAQLLCQRNPFIYTLGLLPGIVELGRQRLHLLFQLSLLLLILFREGPEVAVRDFPGQLVLVDFGYQIVQLLQPLVAAFEFLLGTIGGGGLVLATCPQEL